MRAIMCYPVPISDPTVEVAMPIGASLLHVDRVSGHRFTIGVWAIVDTDVDTERRRFHISATGDRAAPAGAHYIGSVTLNGPQAWHVFDGGPA